MDEVLVDGSLGEGGGQILRQSLLYSVISGRSLRMEKIRHNRKRPGLRRQHLGCIELAKQMCGGRVSPVEVGTTSFVFIPGNMRAGEHNIDIGAGSLTLLASVFFPVAMRMGEPTVLHGHGGTDVPFSPTLAFFRQAFLPMIEDRFAAISSSVPKRGYNPGGGGEVIFRAEGIEGGSGEGMSLVERGESGDVLLHISATNLADHIPGRIADTFTRALSEVIPTRINVRQVVHAESSHDRWRVGVSATAVSPASGGMIASSLCGRRGLSSERLGSMLANDLASEMSQPCVDSRLADQMLPYLFLCGGQLRVREPTSHFRTGILLIERFFEERIERVRMSDSDLYRFHPFGHR